MLDTLQLISLGLETSKKLHSIRQPLINILDNLLVSEITSTWHPYGFLVTRLGSIDSKTFRLHIWPETPYTRQNPDWPIHSHPWEMQSLILHGHLTNCLYHVSYDNLYSTERLYQIIYDGKHSVLQATNQLVSHKLSSENVYIKGEAYYVQANDFHVTNVKEGNLTATLVVTYNANSSPPNVIGRVEGEKSYQYEREICEKDMFTYLILRLRDLLLID